MAFGDSIRSASTPGGSSKGIGGDANTIWHCDSGLDRNYELSTSDFGVIKFAASPDGAPYGIGGDADTIWHCSVGSFPKVYELETAALSVLRETSDVGGNTSGIGGDDVTIWYSRLVDDKVGELYWLDLSVTREVASPSGSPDGIGGDANTIWYCDRNTAKVYELDTSDFSVVREAIAPTNEGRGIGGNNNTIWWADTTTDKVHELDAETLALPTVVTNPATSVEEETAIGNGNITDNGGENCDKRGICWNTTGNPTVADNKSEETDSFGTGAFSRPITGLSPGIKYYVKAYAHNSAGYGYGGEESFTTKPNAPSNLACVAQSSSQIDVNWIKGTGATKTMVRRKVGSYPSDVTDGDQAYYDTGNSFNDTSLVPRTHYYYRAWSWVEGGDIWSDDYAEDSAWTLIGVPTVTTDPATGRGAIAATINGILNQDGGEACECGFEWGLDTGYGTTTPPQSKTSGETFSQVIGGLQPGTTYHFRAFATNSVGTSHGADRTFTTALIISRAFALAREEL
ncbi:hypothetical protein ES703_29626 [subsurface metagenome]